MENKQFRPFPLTLKAHLAQDSKCPQGTHPRETKSYAQTKTNASARSSCAVAAENQDQPRGPSASKWSTRRGSRRTQTPLGRAAKRGARGPGGYAARTASQCQGGCLLRTVSEMTTQRPREQARAAGTACGGRGSGYKRAQEGCAPLCGGRPANLACDKSAKTTGKPRTVGRRAGSTPRLTSCHCFLDVTAGQPGVSASVLIPACEYTITKDTLQTSMLATHDWKVKHKRSLLQQKKSRNTQGCQTCAPKYTRHS